MLYRCPTSLGWTVKLLFPHSILLERVSKITLTVSPYWGSGGTGSPQNRQSAECVKGGNVLQLKSVLVRQLLPPKPPFKRKVYHHSRTCAPAGSNLLPPGGEIGGPVRCAKEMSSKFGFSS